MCDGRLCFAATATVQRTSFAFKKKKNKNGTYAVTSPKITAYKSLHFKCDQGRCKESDGDTDKMSKLL